MAALRAQLVASERTVAQQAEELHKQSSQIAALECRTPRPEWTQLRLSGCTCSTNAAETTSGGETQSSREMARKLCSKLNSYATELKVSTAGSRRSRLGAGSCGMPHALRVL